MAITEEKLLNIILDKSSSENERVKAIVILEKNVGLDRDGLVKKYANSTFKKTSGRKTKAQLSDEVDALYIELEKYRNTAVYWKSKHDYIKAKCEEITNKVDIIQKDLEIMDEVKETHSTALEFIKFVLTITVLVIFASAPIIFTYAAIVLSCSFYYAFKHYVKGALK